MHNLLGRPRDTSQVKIHGTVTFRISSTQILKRWGGNRQNIEHTLRRVWVADEGYSFIQRDQKGAEALIVAMIAPRGQYRDLFDYGVNPHVYVALHNFYEVWCDKYDNPAMVGIALQATVKQLPTLPEWTKLSEFIHSSDDWEGNQRYYYLGKKTGHACLTPNHEVLTPDGWHSITECPTTIMCWSKDMKLSFESVTWNSYDYDGNIYYINEPQCEQFLTPNHKVIYQSNNKWHDSTIEQLAKYNGARIPLCGYYNGTVSLTKEQVQLIVAIQADGSIVSDTYVSFHFRKERKVNRLLEIIKKLNLNYTYNHYDDGSYRISIKDIAEYLKWFIPYKVYGPWLLTWSQENLSTLIDELIYWDGHFEEAVNHKRKEYCSKIVQNIKWIKTICHLTGQQGTLSRKSDFPVVGINRRQLSRLNSVETLPYKGKVYCPTTPTGYFMVRCNRKISITGNSNYGMGVKTFIMSVLKETAGRIALKKPAAEKMLESYHTLFPEIRAWHFQIQRQLKETQTLRNLFGYPRIYTERIGDDMFEEAYSFIPQSTVGVLTSIAYTNLQNYIEEHNLNWHLLTNTHDSFLIEVPDAEIPEALKVTKQFLEMELKAPNGELFRMKSDAVVGKNWAPYTEKNPDGLRKVKDI